MTQITPIYPSADPLDLQGLNDTQADTITRYQRQSDNQARRIDKLQSMYDDSQAYITKIKSENAALKAQLTPEAKAEWIFENEQG